MIGLGGVTVGENGGEEGSVNALVNVDEGVGDLVDVNEGGGA